GRGYHRLRCRRRAGDRAPDRGAATPGDRRRGRSRALPPRPRPLPPQDDRLVGQQAPLRDRRLPRGGRRRTIQARARAGGARQRGAGRCDRLGTRRRSPAPGAANPCPSNAWRLRRPNM
ncbi:MAG: hypothetical protein AVDCRST_MAG55-2071, partial [uncultured Rubrobacteraceae bacterium]